MYYGNSFKIGLFGSNCSSGRAVTNVPERWTGGWQDNLGLARMADDAGIDFLLPIARWKGYGGDTDYQGETLETITWATALLAATRRITVFGTVHASLFHPVVAAKQCVTADHVGDGRFGLNVVCGWNEGEFDMFGVELREHEQRYAFAEEWLTVIRKSWSSIGEDFDFAGQFLSLKGVRAKPKPVGDSYPLIMNAGASPTGREFAIRNCDAFFTNPASSLEKTSQIVQQAKLDARSFGRNLEVFSVGVVTCRPSRREAEDYRQYAVVEQADWSAVDRILATKNVTADKMPAREFQEMRLRQANGVGGVPLVGNPDEVAQQFSDLAATGLRGLAVSFVNFTSELPYFCDEVLPRLQRKGLRIEPPGDVTR
jgi:alkanesulfonate monooxygenase SsuD/methylene tetrahydromethanopterin reductase-like flavin-dependent oxidoreductase (luciferase family)